ncbi:hypothetical protein MNBD_CHLOROFLEXI01-4058, partial [hydrothermal vent metagenome]
ADFELNDDLLPDVAAICHLVAGIPLGIELASAWVRQLSCAEIVQELEQGIGFLQTRAGDVPDRHRSLQAVFDHSWALLTSQEQEVLAQLTVFRGGFSREAARQVTEATLWTLTALVDKSLLHREANGRYELLEMVRQFAAAQLTKMPDQETNVRSRQAHYFLLLLHQQEARWQTDKRQLAIDLLSPEIENILTAWRWAVTSLEASSETAASACNPDCRSLPPVASVVEWLDQALVSLYFLYESYGWFQDGAAAFGWALAALEENASLPQKIYGRLLLRYGRFSIFLGQYDKAQKVLEKARTHLKAINNIQEISLCLSYLAIVSSFQGNYMQAKVEAEESHRLMQQISHLPGLAFVQNLRGTLAHRLGAYDDARKYYEASLQLRRQLEDQHGTAVALNNLGNLANAQQDYQAARRYYEESQLIFKEINHQPGQAATLGNAGVIAMGLGDLAEARRLHEESLILKQALGNRRSISISLINLAEVMCLLRELNASRRTFHEALRLTMAIQAQPLALDALVGLAGLLMEEDQPEQAIRLLQLARRHPASSQETQEKALQQLEAWGHASDEVAELEDLETVVDAILRPYT